MKWSDVGKAIQDVAGAALPTIGTALAGPAGGAVGVLLSKALGVESTPDAVAAALNPDAYVKLQSVEADLQKAQIQADVSNTQSINTTMQAEAKSDHWPTYTWRPFVGFCFGVSWIGSYLIIPMLKAWFPHVEQPNIPTDAWMSIGAVLGVASYFRGKMQADPNVKSDNRG